MSQLPSYTGGYSIPGMNTVLEGVENQFWFGETLQQVWLPDTCSGAARDAGNTVTTLLRTGLLLGKITATGLLKEWNPVGVDGSENLYGILGGMLLAQQGGTNQQRYVGFVMVGGNVYSDRIIIPGNASEGIVGDALEFQVIAQLRRRFLFDRHVTQSSPNGFLDSRYRYMTAAEDVAHAVTVLTSDNGRHFVNKQSDGTTVSAASGTTTFTMPAAKPGLTFCFSASAAQTITMAVASGNIVQPGSVTGTGSTLTTGESAEFVGLSAGLYLQRSCEAID